MEFISANKMLILGAILAYYAYIHLFKASSSGPNGPWVTQSLASGPTAPSQSRTEIVGVSDAQVGQQVESSVAPQSMVMPIATATDAKAVYTSQPAPIVPVIVSQPGEPVKYANVPVLPGQDA